MSLCLTGGCLCGAVRFRADQRPLSTLVCHCTFCQRMTGSSFYANAVFPMAAVNFESGEVQTYAHRSDVSGKQVWVAFCPRCGTTLGLTFERWPQLRAMSRGCFDTPTDLAIDAHIWTRSAAAGTALPAATDCFAKGRVAPDGSLAHATRHGRPVTVDLDRSPASCD